MRADHQGWWSAACGFFLPLLRGRALKMLGKAMRFLLAYLLAVVVFAFGFLCASAFTVGED